MKKIIITSVLSILVNSVFAEKGVTDTTITLGQIGITSGVNEKDVKSFNTGAKAYFDLVNRNKINGRTIELLTTAYTPNIKSQEGAFRAINAQSLALFGINGDSDIVKELIMHTRLEKMPVLAPMLTSSSFVTNSESYVYNLKPTIEQEMTKLFLNFETSGLKKIALITQENNMEYANNIKTIPKFISAPIKKEYVLKADVFNAPAIAKDMMENDIDAVVVLAPAYGTKRMIEETHRVFSPFIAVSDTISNNNALQELIPRENIKLMGIWTSSSIYPLKDDSNELVKEYKQEMRKRYGNDVKLDSFSFDGYVNAKYFTEMIKRTGRDITREKLNKVLSTNDKLAINANIELSVQGKSKYSTIGVIRDKNSIIY